MIELGGENLIASGLFQWVEVGALYVFDDRELERFAVARFDHDDRHFVHAGTLRGTPASFTGDDFVHIGTAAAHHDRLNDAALADRRRQIFQLGFRKQFARIARIGAHEFDRHTALAAHALGGVRLYTDVAHQRRKSSA